MQYDKEAYKEIILNSLYEKGLIDEEIYLKCQPKHIQSLPGNLKTSSVEELEHRLDVIDERITDMNGYITNVDNVKEKLEIEVER